jgi:hypothetical protein
MSHDPHLGFIIAAYVLAFLTVAGMTGAIVADYVRLKRSLSSLAAPEPRQGADGQEADRPNRSPHDPEGSE